MWKLSVEEKCVSKFPVMWLEIVAMSSQFPHFPLHQQPSCRPPVNPHTSLTQTPTLAAGNAIDTVLTVSMQREGKKSKVVMSPAWKSTYFPSSDEFTAYEKYARWQAQSGNPFIDYFMVLDIGVWWEKRSYGKLSSAEWVHAFILHIIFFGYL